MSEVHDISIDRISESFKKGDGCVMHMFVDGKTYGVGVFFDKEDDWGEVKKNLDMLSLGCWHKWMEQKHGSDVSKWPSLSKNRDQDKT